MKTICLVSFLLLTGCKAMKDAPISHLYIPDLEHEVCSKRVITDKSTLASVWVEDLALVECEGVIGLDSEEFMNLRTYLKDNK